MAQMPRLTCFFLGWVGLGLLSSFVGFIRTFTSFPTQHNQVNRKHPITVVYLGSGKRVEGSYELAQQATCNYPQRVCVGGLRTACVGRFRQLEMGAYCVGAVKTRDSSCIHA